MVVPLEKQLRHREPVCQRRHLSDQRHPSLGILAGVGTRHFIDGRNILTRDPLAHPPGLDRGRGIYDDRHLPIVGDKRFERSLKCRRQTLSNTNPNTLCGQRSIACDPPPRNSNEPTAPPGSHLMACPAVPGPTDCNARQMPPRLLAHRRASRVGPVLTPVILGDTVRYGVSFWSSPHPGIPGTSIRDLVLPPWSTTS